MLWMHSNVPPSLPSGKISWYTYTGMCGVKDD
jgi:hypothetical protein